MVRSAFSKRHPRPPARKPARGEPISIHPITLVFSHEAHEQFFRIQQFRKVAKFGQFLRFMCGYQLAVSLAAPIFGAGFFYATREEDSTSIWTAVELFFSNRTVLTVAINAIHFAGVAVGINYMFVQNLSQTRVHEARVHSLCSWFHFFNVVCFSLVTWLFSFDLDPHVGLPIFIRSFTGTVATICYTHLFACSFSVRVNLLAFLTFLMVIYPPAQLSDVVSLAQQRCLCLVAICAGELVGYLVEHTSIRPYAHPDDALRRCTPVGYRTYHHIRPPLRRTDDSHPPMPVLRARCGPWEGDEGRAVVASKDSTNEAERRNARNQSIIVTL